MTHFSGVPPFQLLLIFSFRWWAFKLKVRVVYCPLHL